MRKLIFYTIFLLLFSCRSQQVTFDSLRGSFIGLEEIPKQTNSKKYSPFWYIKLELNQDSTCILRKTFDLSKIECVGEWNILNNNLIEIKCNKNPILNNVQKALQSGCYIDESFTVKILSKNKLKLNNTTLKRNK